MRQMPHRFKSGELSRADADALSKLAQQLADIYGMQVSEPLQVNQGPGGFTLTLGRYDFEAIVKVTSATAQTVKLLGGATTTAYPAAVENWYATTAAYEDGPACWFVGANSEVPNVETRYLARHLGPDGGGKAIYTTQVGGGKLLVQITARTYTGGAPFAAYSCNVVTDSTSPAALTYTAGSAGPTFYNLNDVALPVGAVVWISQSQNGTWYLNDNDTVVDVVTRTSSTPDANGLYDGTLYVYDDLTHALISYGAVKLLDVSGP